jgi:hypothetical protein
MEPVLPLVLLLPEKFEVKLYSYRTGMSSSARISGWLGTVMVTCGILPSLTLGSRGSDTTPFLLAVTHTCRNLQIAPQDFPLAGAFGLQHFAVRISDHRSPPGMPPGSRIVWIDPKLKGWKSWPCDSPLPLLATCLEKSNTEPTTMLRVHARFCEDCCRDSTALRIGREELHGGVTCTSPSCRPSQSVPR